MLFRKTITWLLLITFICQGTSHAIAESMAQPKPPYAPFLIDPSIGAVEDTFLSPASDKILYLIQDAHTNESAQRHIAAILEKLSVEKKVRCIFLEAGTGDDSLSHLRPLAPLAKRKSVADIYLRKGYLQGADYLDLTSDLDILLWGVEDKTLYWESLSLYREIARERSLRKEQLAFAKRALLDIESEVLPPALKLLQNKRRDFIQGDSPAQADYIHTLTLEAARQPERLLLAFPTLRRLLRLHREQDKFDAQKTSAKKIAAMNRRATSLDPRAILDESRALEGILFSALCQSEDQSRLIAASRALETLDKLFSLALTAEEAQAIEASPEQFDLTEISGFLNRLILESGKHYENTLSVDEGFESCLEKCLRFYALTRDRDQVFLKRSLDKMSSEDTRVAALITGGYHTPHLKQLLRQRGISYVCITPRVLKESRVLRYEEILLGKNLNTLPAAELVVPAGDGARLSMRDVIMNDLVPTTSPKGARMARKDTSVHDNSKENKNTKTRFLIDSPKKIKTPIGAKEKMSEMNSLYARYLKILAQLKMIPIQEKRKRISLLLSLSHARELANMTTSEDDGSGRNESLIPLPTTNEELVAYLQIKGDTLRVLFSKKYDFGEPVTTTLATATAVKKEIGAAFQDLEELFTLQDAILFSRLRYNAGDILNDKNRSHLDKLAAGHHDNTEMIARSLNETYDGDANITAAEIANIILADRFLNKQKEDRRENFNTYWQKKAPPTSLFEEFQTHSQSKLNNLELVEAYNRRVDVRKYSDFEAEDIDIDKIIARLREENPKKSTWRTTFLDALKLKFDNLFDKDAKTSLIEKLNALKNGSTIYPTFKKALEEIAPERPMRIDRLLLKEKSKEVKHRDPDISKRINKMVLRVLIDQDMGEVPVDPTIMFVWEPPTAQAGAGNPSKNKPNKSAARMAVSSAQVVPHTPTTARSGTPNEVLEKNISRLIVLIGSVQTRLTPNESDSLEKMRSSLSEASDIIGRNEKGSNNQHTIYGFFSESLLALEQVISSVQKSRQPDIDELMMQIEHRLDLTLSTWEASINGNRVYPEKLHADLAYYWLKKAMRLGWEDSTAKKEKQTLLGYLFETPFSTIASKTLAQLKPGDERDRATVRVIADSDGFRANVSTIKLGLKKRPKNQRENTQLVRDQNTLDALDFYERALDHIASLYPPIVADPEKDRNFILADVERLEKKLGTIELNLKAAVGDQTKPILVKLHRAMGEVFRFLALEDAANTDKIPLGFLDTLYQGNNLKAVNASMKKIDPSSISIEESFLDILERYAVLIQSENPDRHRMVRLHIAHQLMLSFRINFGLACQKNESDLASSLKKMTDRVVRLLYSPDELDVRDTLLKIHKIYLETGPLLISTSPEALSRLDFLLLETIRQLSELLPPSSDPTTDDPLEAIIATQNNREFAKQNKQLFKALRLRTNQANPAREIDTQHQFQRWDDRLPILRNVSDEWLEKKQRMVRQLTDIASQISPNDNTGLKNKIRNIAQPLRSVNARMGLDKIYPILLNVMEFIYDKNSREGLDALDLIMPDVDDINDLLTEFADSVQISHPDLFQRAYFELAHQNIRDAEKLAIDTLGDSEITQTIITIASRGEIIKSRTLNTNSINELIFMLAALQKKLAPVDETDPTDKYKLVTLLEKSVEHLSTAQTPGARLSTRPSVTSRQIRDFFSTLLSGVGHPAVSGREIPMETHARTAVSRFRIESVRGQMVLLKKTRGDSLGGFRRLLLLLRNIRNGYNPNSAPSLADIRTRHKEKTSQVLGILSGLNLDTSKPTVVMIDASFLDAGNFDPYADELLDALHRASKSPLLKNTHFVATGESKQRLLDRQGDESIVLSAIPAELTGVPTVWLAPPALNKAGQINLPVAILKGGDVPVTEALFYLAAVAGRIDMTRRPEGFDTSYNLLAGGESADVSTLTDILLGRASMETLYKHSLQPLLRTLLNTAVRFFNLTRRMADQSA